MVYGTYVSKTGVIEHMDDLMVNIDGDVWVKRRHNTKKAGDPDKWVRPTIHKRAGNPYINYCRNKVSSKYSMSRLVYCSYHTVRPGEAHGKVIYLDGNCYNFSLSNVHLKVEERYEDDYEWLKYAQYI